MCPNRCRSPARRARSWRSLSESRCCSATTTSGPGTFSSACSRRRTAPAAPAKVRDHIGVVSQGNSLDRSLNAIENLEYHGRYFRMSRREARSQAMALLERFGLADRAGAQVTALSGAWPAV